MFNSQIHAAYANFLQSISGTCESQGAGLTAYGAAEQAYWSADVPDAPLPVAAADNRLSPTPKALFKIVQRFARNGSALARCSSS